MRQSILNVYALHILTFNIVDALQNPALKKEYAINIKKTLACSNGL